MNYTFSQTLMILSLGLSFGGYFLLIWHKHKKGKILIINKDPRLYPENYHELQKSDRRRLYRIHTWREAWDNTGKKYAGLTGIGVVLFFISILI